MTTITRRQMLRKVALASGAVALYHVLPAPASLPGASAQTPSTGLCAQTDTGSRCANMPEPPASPPPMPEGVERSTRADPPAAPAVTNRVRKLSADAVRSLEDGGARIVENQDGLIAFEHVRSGKRLRTGLFNAKTPAGVDVIGLVFLDEQKIRELEARQKASSGNALGLGASVAHADVLPYDHYHYFWHCSYVYQYAFTWDCYVYLCPVDATMFQGVGTAVATLIGAGLGGALPAFVGGVSVLLGVWYFMKADGSLDFFLPGDSIVYHFGHAYYYGPPGWFFFYPEGDPNFGYARRLSDGTLWPIW